MTTFINASTAGLTETVDASGVLGLQTANTTAVIIGADQNANFTSTGAMIVPRGTTAQRPTGVNGMIRYNTDTNVLEGYVGGSWTTIKSAAPYSVPYLVIAGGGGGSSSFSGGGAGAGGYLSNTATFSPGIVYTITVGAGGAANQNGTTSTITATGFTNVSAIAGGFGGGFSGTGGNGGSGGGQSGYTAGGGPGTGTAGQGNNGGTSTGSYQVPHIASGGGGAGAAGSNSVNSGGGAGGAGSASSITGTSVTRAGGGGGGGGFGTGASGGSGGGGAGGNGNGSGTTLTNGGNGTANTGGGGGGAGGQSAPVGGSGGSGVVILSVPTTNYSGVTTGTPTVSISGSNTVLQFNSSGTYTA